MKTTIVHDGQITTGEIRHQYADGRAEVTFPGGGWLIVPPSLRTDIVDAGTGRPLPTERFTRDQLAVLRCLAQVGSYGCIDDDYEQMIGLRADSAGKRRLELVRRGLVIASGAKRETRRGGTAEIWVITDAGRDALHSARAAGAA